MKKLLKKTFFKYYLFFLRHELKKKAERTSDLEYVRKKFKNNFGIYPNLENPKRFNEHISKILLTPPNKIIQQCVDKYEVRGYVAKKVGNHILNEIYGLYNSVEEIQKDWGNLPDQFVLKATHGCGWNYICKDKNKTDFKKLKILVNHWLKSNFYYAQRELVYKNLKPRIIIEKYLEDESGGLIDYKFHCFNGKPKFLNVVVDRFNNIKLNTYDLYWNFIDVNFDYKYLPNDRTLKIEKPDKFDEMLEYCQKLSAEFFYVRLDLYLVLGKIYFGEFTFTPGNGSYTFSDKEDQYMGKFFNN